MCSSHIMTMMVVFILILISAVVVDSSIGPIARFSFDSASQVHDDSGHVSDNDITLSDASWASTDIAGVVPTTGNTHAFYGNGHSFTIPSSSLWFMDSSSGYTVSVWAKMVSANTVNWAVTPFFQVQETGGYQYLMLGVRQIDWYPNWLSLCAINRGDDKNVQVDSDRRDGQYLMPYNTYQHLVFIWDGPSHTSRVYLNGQLAISQYFDIPVSNMPKPLADRYTVVGNADFLLDELLVFDRPLSNSEISDAAVGIYPQSAAAVGDPAFTGFLGQSYQIHGIANSVYNVISTPLLQLNMLFVFMGKGRNLKAVRRSAFHSNTTFALPSTASWSHPGQYLGESALKLFSAVSGNEFMVYIRPGTYENGFITVTVNNKPIVSGDRIDIEPGCSVHLEGSHKLKVTTSSLNFTLVNADKFINIEDAQYKPIKGENGDIQGLLGWSAYDSTIKVPDVESYVLESNKLFGDDFEHNRYRSQIQ